MVLARTPEPELMDSATEADDYDRMDFSAVNERFVQDARAYLGSLQSLLDVGTGTGRIPLAFARGPMPARFVAIDAAPAMLARARANQREADSVASTIVFAAGNATELAFESASFEGVISNSLVHHLPDPAPFFSELARVCAPGARAFVRDLARPASADEALRLTELYAAIPAEAHGDDRERFARQRALFHASLHAAFTVAEVHAMAIDAGLEGARVTMTSDRHWTLTWTKP